MAMARRLLKLAAVLAVCSVFFTIPGLRSVRRIKSPTSSYSRLSHLQSASVKVVEPFGKGLMEDIRRKAPYVKSDVTDALTPAGAIKVLSTTFFLFFACLAPAVAFGGLLATATGGSMGTMEAVMATALSGVLYALFSGQPLTIIGTTGPLLAFLKVLHTTCASRGIPFLPVYAWTGLWSALILYLSAFFSISNVLEYFTRFTDDIFSSLISVIFIYEAVVSLAANFANPAVSGVQAVVSLVVASTTFLTAFGLSKLRNTPYFPRKVRCVLILNDRTHAAGELQCRLLHFRTDRPASC